MGNLFEVNDWFNSHFLQCIIFLRTSFIADKFYTSKRTSTHSCFKLQKKSKMYMGYGIRLTLRSLRENRGRLLFWRAEFCSRTLLFSISGSFGFNVNEDIWWENESFDWPSVKESFDWLVLRQPELPTLSAPASPTQALKNLCYISEIECHCNTLLQCY